MSRPAYPDYPRLSWGDCGDWEGTSCVIGMPHDADPLKVGMEIHRTEAGSSAMPDYRDITEVKKTWGRILTVREQWEYKRIAQDGCQPESIGDPPEKWYPEENVPAWQECAETVEGAEPIWIVSWRS